MNHYSQYGQDRWVRELFLKAGQKLRLPAVLHFVEAGAGNGVELSNTKLLEENSWTGLLIEPHPKAFKALCRNRALSAVCVEALLWGEGGVELDFSMRKGWKSRIVGQSEVCNPPESRRVQRRAAREAPIKLKTRTLYSILEDEYFESFKTTDIHYMSLDLEGAEERVLRDFPFEEWKPWTLSIERPGVLLHKRLKKVGYWACKVFGEDSMYIHEDFLKTLPKEWA